MTPEKLYKKEFGHAESVPKDQVIRLLKHFARVLHDERSNALRILDVQVKSEQSHYLEFCSFVTGHDEETILQMYEDWKRFE